MPATNVHAPACYADLDGLRLLPFAVCRSASSALLPVYGYRLPCHCGLLRTTCRSAVTPPFRLPVSTEFHRRFCHRRSFAVLPAVLLPPFFCLRFVSPFTVLPLPAAATTITVFCTTTTVPPFCRSTVVSLLPFSAVLPACVLILHLPFHHIPAPFPGCGYPAVRLRFLPACRFCRGFFLPPATGCTVSATAFTGYLPLPATCLRYLPFWCVR